VNREELIALEDTATRAWAAAEEERQGNWLLRFNHGYTKRANSAYVIGPVEADAIPALRDWYANRSLPLHIRETSLWANPGLQAELERRKFRRFDETLVMTGSTQASHVGIELIEPGAWISWYAAFEGATKGNQSHHLALINRITTPVAPAVYSVDGQPVACGLAVADGNRVGLFDIATDPDRRREGHGRAMVSGLLAWGAALGASWAYLQVLATNAPAIRLYEGLGFREAYRNWYWTER
jgi:ribosomal protein S18 acetylase RimI-like enzyme